jgi:hypothetical protein
VKHGSCNRPCTAGYASGCRCAECREVWRVYMRPRVAQWRKKNPEKYQASKDRSVAARRTRDAAS